ncbi:MAG: serine hydrolase [Chloroflexi bacterium]|nr:serine hydrolase [Chloroflexota bacterium]
MHKIFKWIGSGLLVLAGLLVVVIIGAYIIYPAEYVSRVLRWQDADVKDYQKFPEAVIDNAPPVYQFEQDHNEAFVRDGFETALAVDDLELFLEDTGTQAFIVIQDEAILYEGYFNRYTRDSIVTSFSVAKSFVSTLVGVAIEEGHIQSVDDPITDYLPELLERDAQFTNITVGDLMHMSSGIHYVEASFLHGDDAKTYYYPDLRTLALEETRIDGLPGEEFLYNNYHPLLLGVILERATGVSVAEYLQEKIWKPLGMEYPASWSLDSEDTQFEKMESGINARAIDFAKFGRLFLNNGGWEGQQVIPAEWVMQATQRDTSFENGEYYYDSFIFEDGRGYYQYFWWGLTVDEQTYDYMALGNHGQFIYISPEKDLIIVRNGERYGADTLKWIYAFYDFARAFPANE